MAASQIFGTTSEVYEKYLATDTEFQDQFSSKMVQNEAFFTLLQIKNFLILNLLIIIKL